VRLARDPLPHVLSLELNVNTEQGRTWTAEVAEMDRTNNLVRVSGRMASDVDAVHSAGSSA
jgi:hypothetical protein